MRRVLAAACLGVLLSPGAVGQINLAELPEPERTALDRFRLYDACRPMALWAPLAADGREAEEIGLGGEDLRLAAESRLRAARLYADPDAAKSLLQVSVSLFGSAFHVKVEYYKKTTDASGQPGPSITWQAGSLGVHGKNADYVVSSLSRLLDRFIAEYLRVNAEDCGSPAP